MKKLYVLIWLVFAVEQLYAQQAYYQLEINGNVGFTGSDCGEDIIGGLQWIAAGFSDNHYETLVSGSGGYPYEGHGLRDTNINKIITFTQNNLVTNLNIFTIKRKKTLGLCRSVKRTFANLSVSTCQNQNYNFYSLGLNQPGNLTVKVTPVIELAQGGTENRNIGSEDAFGIAPIIGVSNSYFNWEYSIDGKTWIRFPAKFQHKNSVSTGKASEIFTHLKPENGDEFYIRVNTGCNKTSNAIIYTYSLSAPHITSINTSKVSCYDSKDATATIKFDRPLKTGEDINIIIKKPGSENNYGENNVTALSANNSYTFNDLPIGRYNVTLIGGYYGNTTYSESPSHSASFTIERPDPVEFTTSSVNVWCNGGEDGSITISATGGVEGVKYQYVLREKGSTVQNWQNFSNATNHTISRLAPNDYEVLVRDTNGCFAREVSRNSAGNIIGLGAIIVHPVTITEPKMPVAITYVYHEEPTAYGFTNGLIRAQVTGGTPKATGIYNYTWQYEDGSVWATTTQEVVAEQGSFLTLNNAPAGTYTLTVTDANYNNATDKQSCTIQESTFLLTQPDPLEVTLSIHQEISCHQNNEYGDETDTTPQDSMRDESQNGALLASVTGGVPFLFGSPYLYTWKKQNENGDWETLVTQTDNIAISLSDGRYALNIEDANGIVLGSYQNNTLVKAIDSTFYLHEPEKLEMVLSATPVSCSGNDGSISAHVTGGTPPYTYYWSNGEVGSAPAVKNLYANNYFVQVIDAKGCQIKGSVAVSQPDDFYIEVLAQKNPSCFGGNDGVINIAIMGGTPPYTSYWNNGKTTKDIAGLRKGTYTVTVTDAQGCTLYRDFVLDDPKEFTIDLGPDTTLCNEQSILLDATIDANEVTYEWIGDNGFSQTGARVAISESGTYQVIATTAAGCVAQDEITITTVNQAIDANFLISSQAFVKQEVVLVNISEPIGETSTWLIPEGVTINEQNNNRIKLLFPEAKTYKIGLQSTQGNCFEVIYKNIVVEESAALPDPGDTKNPFIEKFVVAQGADNNGIVVLVTLTEQSPISIRIFDIDGSLVTDVRRESGRNNYIVRYSEYLPPGVYMAVLETAKDTQIKRMIKQ